MLMLISGPSDALRPQTIQTAPPPPEPVSQSTWSSVRTDASSSEQAKSQPPALQTAPLPDIAPVATRQSAELVEAMLRLDAPKMDAPPAPEYDRDQTRAMIDAAQSLWRDAPQSAAIQPAAPTVIDASSPDATNPEPSLASQAATTAPVEPRLMMTV